MTSDGPAHTAPCGAEYIAPAPLLATLAVAINDHLLKGSSLPEWFTGKASDFLGLFFFPLLVSAVWGCAARRLGRTGPRTGVRVAAAGLVTGIIFAGWKLVPEFARWTGESLTALAPGLLYQFEPDPTDLLSLPSLGVAWFYARHGIRAGRVAE